MEQNHPQATGFARLRTTVTTFHQKVQKKSLPENIQPSHLFLLPLYLFKMKNGKLMQPAWKVTKKAMIYITKWAVSRQLLH